jgi:hypothetical protein
MIHDAACSHNTVIRVTTTNSETKLSTDSWQCQDCPMTFVPCVLTKLEPMPYCICEGAYDLECPVHKPESPKSEGLGERLQATMEHERDVLLGKNPKADKCEIHTFCNKDQCGCPKAEECCEDGHRLSCPKFKISPKPEEKPYTRDQIDELLKKVLRDADNHAMELCNNVLSKEERKALRSLTNFLR